MDVINSIQIIDAQILLFIQNFMRFEWLDGIMIAYTKTGNAGILWIAMSVVMLFFKKTRLTGILSLLAMGIGLVFTNFTLKPLVTRDRPYLVVEGLLPLMSPPEPNSFPSGHTTAAFAMLAIGENALSNKWMRRGLLLLVVLMAFSRLTVNISRRYYRRYRCR